MPNPTSLRIVYCNVNRSIPAHDILEKTAEELSANVICYSEPNLGLAGRCEYGVDASSDVVIASNLGWMAEGAGEGFVWLELKQVVLYTCYISPNVDIGTFIGFLRRLKDSAQQHKKPVLMIGDFNAWSTVWGCRKTDRRGYALLEWLNETAFVQVNTGPDPTCVRGNSESVIDLVLCSRGLRANVTGGVLESETLSDHMALCVDIVLSAPENHHVLGGSCKFARYNDRHREALLTCIGDRISDTSSVDEFMAVITEACEHVMKKNTFHKRQRKQKHWWNGEIAQLRIICVKSRRLFSKARRSNRYDPLALNELWAAYRVNKYALRNAIRESKEKDLYRTLAELDKNPWGPAYQLLKKSGRNAPVLCQAEEIGLFQNLFPTHPPAVFKPINQIRSIVPFTTLELLGACCKLKKGKSPGPDEVPVEVAWLVCMEFTEKCLEMYNWCLTRGEFPDCWKITKLVLIPKPKKARSDPTTYRPICLTNVMGKILEHMIQRRLRLETVNRLSNAQYGFRKGLSSVDAIKRVIELGCNAKRDGKHAVLVTLDVKNAFNSVAWADIDNALLKKGSPEYLRKIIQSYLSSRSMLVGGDALPTSAGVPQGSVLGPLLWVMLYDGVLELKRELGVDFCCYADDLAIIVTANTRVKLMAIVQRALNGVVAGLRSLGLSIAVEKTEAVMISSKRDAKPLPITVAGHDEEILTQEAVRYLGVWIGRDMRMYEHVKQVRAKALKRSFALAPLMPATGGPGDVARRIQAQVVYSTLLYGYEAWGRVATQKDIWKQMESATRPILLLVGRGDGTMSTAAAEVMAGLPPIDLRASEVLRRADGQSKEQARTQTENSWIERWKVGGSEWMKEVIPDIKPWIGRGHGRITRELARAISGRGPFGDVLHQIGARDSAACGHCGWNDSARHSVFHCRITRKERRELERAIGPFTPKGMVAAMLKSEEWWLKVATYLEVIGERRREAERRQGEAVGGCGRM